MGFDLSRECSYKPVWRADLHMAVVSSEGWLLQKWFLKRVAFTERCFFYRQNVLNHLGVVFTEKWSLEGRGVNLIVVVVCRKGFWCLRRGVE